MKQLPVAFFIAGIMLTISCGNNNNTEDSNYPATSDTARIHSDTPGTNPTNGYAPPGKQDSTANSHDSSK